MATESIRQWCNNFVAALTRTPRYDLGQRSEYSEDDEEAQLTGKKFKRCQYETGDDESPPKKTRFWPWILLLLAAVAGTALVTTSLTRRPFCNFSPTRYQPSHPPSMADGHGQSHIEDNRLSHDGEVKECGASPEEAQARGCVFEQQLAAWVPRACGFPAVIDEYRDNFGDMMAEWTWLGPQHHHGSSAGERAGFAGGKLFGDLHQVPGLARFALSLLFAQDHLCSE